MRLFRFPIILLAGTLGLFGIVLAVMMLLIHLSGLRSFGVPYLSPASPLSIQGVVLHNTTNLDLMNPKYIQELNRALSDKIVADIQEAIRQLQAFKSDGIASGTEIYRQFAKQRFAVTAEAQVRQVGMLGPQLELRSPEVIR